MARSTKKKIQFKDIDWDSIDPNKVSCSWESQVGFYIVIWKKNVGSANNKIIHDIKVPESIESCLTDYVESIK